MKMYIHLKTLVILQNIKDKNLKSNQHNDNQTGSRLLIRSNRNQKRNNYSLKMLKEITVNLENYTPDNYHSTQRG